MQPPQRLDLDALKGAMIQEGRRSPEYPSFSCAHKYSPGAILAYLHNQVTAAGWLQDNLQRLPRRSSVCVCVRTG